MAPQRFGRAYSFLCSRINHSFRQRLQFIENSGFSISSYCCVFRLLDYLVISYKFLKYDWKGKLCLQLYFRICSRKP